MTELTARARARLPNSAFAYIDSEGRRRLPINDEAHVRNALARFDRVTFEDDAARERARKRLLTAAKKYGIVPIGFMASQLRSERLSAAIEAGTADARKLPTGVLTFLLTDIEDSTGLLRRLGDRYAGLLEDVRTIIRAAVREGGREVDARADEFFAVFPRADAAAQAAIEIQRSLRGRDWPEGEAVPVRMGLHTGEPALTPTGYVGLDVHIAARVCGAGHGGQIIVSDAACEALGTLAPDGPSCRSLGIHRLPRLPQPMELFQLAVADLPSDFPPPRTTRVSFAHVAPTTEAEADLPGWG
jgi:class 3 adenylate cyclase